MKKNTTKTTKNSTSTKTSPFEVRFKMITSSTRDWDNYEKAAWLSVQNPKTKRYVHLDYYTRMRDAYKGIQRWLERNQLSTNPFRVIKVS